MITNFGGNVKFSPKHIYYPKTEQEVLEILNSHKNGQIRVISSLHAWSEAVVSEDVVINLKNLNQVEIAGNLAKVGGGCILQRCLDIIHSKTNLTIPTLGGIKRQTIAGVVSTGTHGSGKSSISHYMEEIRIAAYDEGGEAKIYEFKSGEELKAARCAVGCMGVILSVRFKLVPMFWVKETLGHYKSLDEVLKNEDKYELQQFMLIPYLWEYFVHQRQVLSKKPAAGLLMKGTIQRFYDFLSIEYASHLLLKTILLISSSTKGSSKFIIWFYQKIVPLLIKQGTIVGNPEQGLTLHTSHHYYFKHVEMELFVPRAKLKRAIEIIKKITDQFAKDTYTHHYPIFFRLIKKDDTLISMSEGGDCYSISFFTYKSEKDRKYFYHYCKIMAEALNKECEARLHWGKYFPLEYKDMRNLFPKLGEFRKICQTLDPKGVFQNEFTKRVLGF